MTSDVKLFTNSEAQTWKRCRRKWWLTYYRRLVRQREEMTGPRALGTRVHLGLEALYESGYNEQAMWDAMQHAYETDIELADDIEIFEKEHELAKIMLEGYLEWLAEEGADAEFEFLGAERKVDVPFDTIRDREVRLLAKLDLRMRSKVTEFRYFVDHKTVGSLGEIPKWIAINEQFLHYNLVDLLEAKAMGDERRTDGGIFNMLRKVKRTVRAKPPFYDRVQIRYNDDQLRAFFRRLWGEVDDIIRAEQRLDAGEDPSVVVYPTPRRECTWDCDFFIPCQLMDDPLSDAEGALSMDYEEKDPLARYELDLGDDTKESE